MAVDQHESSPTPQIEAPRTAEQHLAGATSAHDIGYGRRSARGRGYELRGLAYVPVSRLHEGRFGRMFRLPPFIPSDERIAEIAALMLEEVSGPTPELTTRPSRPATPTWASSSTMTSPSTPPPAWSGRTTRTP
jgi:hypothetical protein